MQAVQESKQRVKIHKAFVRSPSKRLIAIGPGGTTMSPLVNGASGSDSNGSVSHNGKAPSALAATHTSILTITKTSRPHHDKVTSKQVDTMPRKAWEQQSDEYDIQLLVFKMSSNNLNVIYTFALTEILAISINAVVVSNLQYLLTAQDLIVQTELSWVEH